MELGVLLNKKRMLLLAETRHSYYCLSRTLHKFIQEDYINMYNTRRAINCVQSGASPAKWPFLLKPDPRSLWFQIYNMPYLLCELRTYIYIHFLCNLVHFISKHKTPTSDHNVALCRIIYSVYQIYFLLGWKKLHNKEFRNLSSSPNRVTKSRSVGWACSIRRREFIKGSGWKSRRKKTTT